MRLSITPGNLIIRSVTPIIFIQSSTFMAARLRDYLPASDKILPDRFFLASAPNLQFLSISYYVGNGSLGFRRSFLAPRKTFEDVGAPGASLLARFHTTSFFPRSHC